MSSKLYKLCDILMEKIKQENKNVTVYEKFTYVWYRNKTTKSEI